VEHSLYRDESLVVSREIENNNRVENDLHQVWICCTVRAKTKGSVEEDGRSCSVEPFFFSLRGSSNWMQMITKLWLKARTKAISSNDLTYKSLNGSLLPSTYNRYRPFSRLG